MADFKYSERLAHSSAPEILEFYGRPHLASELAALPVHLDIHKAHAVMLCERGILDVATTRALLAVLTELESRGTEALVLRPELNDLHTNTDVYLVERLGEDIGGRLHTGKSRNDFAYTVARMGGREDLLAVSRALLDLQAALLDIGRAHVDTVLPGYTHISQHAQPITLAHFALAFVDAFDRDLERLSQAYAVVNQCPMGGAALAGTGFPLDRARVAQLLGFSGVVENTIDATGGRDFQLQALAALAILTSTLGRLAESLLLWNIAEVGMIELPDEYCSISSIMPQKKNPVSLEMVRAEVSVVSGRFVTAMSVLKGSTLGEGREVGAVDGLVPETARDLRLLLPMMANVLRGMRVKVGVMRQRAAEGFSTVTELADELVRHTGISFRKAHRIVGAAVAHVIAQGGTPADLTAETIGRAAAELYGAPLVVSAEMVARALNPEENVRVRALVGGPAPREVERMLGIRSTAVGARAANVAEREAHLADARRALNATVQRYVDAHEAVP